MKWMAAQLNRATPLKEAGKGNRREADVSWEKGNLFHGSLFAVPR